jgi:hypothetical protein
MRLLGHPSSKLAWALTRLLGHPSSKLAWALTRRQEHRISSTPAPHNIPNNSQTRGWGECLAEIASQERIEIFREFRKIQQQRHRGTTRTLLILFCRRCCGPQAGSSRTSVLRAFACSAILRASWDGTLPAILKQRFGNTSQKSRHRNESKAAVTIVI